jgi:uridine phosphorylase
MELCRSAGYRYFTGITRSHDSFYIDDEADQMKFWHDRGVLASDMETSALYTIASLRGVRAVSILNNVVLYEGDLKEGINDYVNQDDACGEGEKREILIALKTLEIMKDPGNT